MHRDVKPHNVMIDHEKRKVRRRLPQVYTAMLKGTVAIDRLGTP